MSGNNAPQPDANGPAEVFDSTVAPPSGQISQDAIPGGPTPMASVFATQQNTIDVIFSQQFIALTTFIWSTINSPGQLLWYVPIHPTYVHQFMSHLTKMYNVFAGGFDFSLTIAGTGFHAGKLIVVRLPPNIHPKTLRRVTDITAFPYYIIDPKTLETIIKSASDQRDVMYHYLPFDESDKRSFGGYLAVYVMLPLATSSTGATEISVQVLSKPTVDFTFAQLRPIREEQVDPFNAEIIEDALDFTYHHSDPFLFEQINSIWVNTAKEIKELTVETINCYRLDGKIMNGDAMNKFDYTFNFDKTMVSKFVTNNCVIGKTGGGGCVFGAQDTSKNFLVSWEHLADSSLSNPDVNYFPDFTTTQARIVFKYTAATNPSRYTFTIWGQIRRKTVNDPAGLSRNIFESYNGGWSYTMSDNTQVVEIGNLDSLFTQGKWYFNLIFDYAPKFDFDYVPYSPPIPESVVTFECGDRIAAQPYQLAQILCKAKFKNIISPDQSMIFELIDTKVGLPLVPMRLHYNGYISSISVTNNVEYKVEQADRYKFDFVGFLPETTAMTAAQLPKLSSFADYRRNIALSRQWTSEMF